MPDTINQYYFGSGRQGIYTTLQKLANQHTGRLKVAVPAWSCSILHSILDSIEVDLVLMDVQPSNMRMRVQDILEKAPDVVILVAENGSLYSKNDIQALKSADITTIGDYCLALRNFERIKDLRCDYNVFSGGFSKPISSLGLGIVCTDFTLSAKNSFHKGFSIKSLIMLIMHLIIQRPVLYKLLKGFIRDPGIEEFYPKASNKINIRHINVLLSELDCFKKELGDWQSLQGSIFEILHLDCPNHLLSKILVPVKILKSIHAIHFHHQYRWTNDFLSGHPRLKGCKDINENYISLAISRSCVRQANKFIQALKTSIKYESS